MHEQIGPLLYTLEEYRNNKGISFDLEMEPLIEIKINPAIIIKVVNFKILVLQNGSLMWH